MLLILGQKRVKKGSKRGQKWSTAGKKHPVVRAMPVPAVASSNLYSSTPTHSLVLTQSQMNPTGNHNKPLVITVFFTTLNLHPLFTVSASVSNIPTKVLVQGILRALRLDLTGCCVERPLVFASLVRICVVRFTSLEPDFVAVRVRAVHER